MTSTNLQNPQVERQTFPDDLEGPPRPAKPDTPREAPPQRPTEPQRSSRPAPPLEADELTAAVVDALLHRRVLSRWQSMIAAAVAVGVVIGGLVAGVLLMIVAIGLIGSAR